MIFVYLGIAYAIVGAVILSVIGLVAVFNWSMVAGFVVVIFVIGTVCGTMAYLDEHP